MTPRMNFILLGVVGITTFIAGYRIGRTELMAVGIIITAISGIAALIRNDIPKHSQSE